MLGFHLVLHLVLLLSYPAFATAQGWDNPWSDPRDRPGRVDLSATAGLLAPTDWSDLTLLGSLSSASGVLEQVLARDIRVEPGNSFGAAVTYWESRYGFRVQAARSKSSLAIGLSESVVDLDTWLYDVRGAVGLVDYQPTRWVWPYVFAGAGGISYDISRGVSAPIGTFIKEAPPVVDQRVIVSAGDRQFVIGVDELKFETVFAVNFGIGTDFRIPLGPAGVGVRFEVSDHVAGSPLRLSIHELSRVGGLPSNGAVRFGAVHHLRADVGLVVQLGR
jgi:hypothetical protein